MKKYADTLITKFADFLMNKSTRVSEIVITIKTLSHEIYELSTVTETLIGTIRAHHRTLQELIKNQDEIAMILVKTKSASVDVLSNDDFNISDKDKKPVKSN